MQHHLRTVLSDADLAQTLVANGLRAIRDRHSCDHRADELLAICASLGPAARTEILRKAV
jgi:spore maturation protein CgeB